MNKQPLKPIRVGILLNSEQSAETSTLEKQYTINDVVYEEIADVLRKHGVKVEKIEVRSDVFGLLQGIVEDLDLIFNLTQGIYQILVPMVLEQLKKEKNNLEIVFTGASSKGHTLALDKSITRKVLQDKVLQPSWWHLADDSIPLPEDISFPVLVKPTNEGHSIGIKQANVVFSREELDSILAQQFSKKGNGVLIESFLDGDEYSMGIVGNVVFPAAVWDLNDIPGKPLVRGEDLKQNDMTLPHGGLVKDPELALSIAKQVINAHKGLGLLDYSRSDFRAMKGKEGAYFIEINSGCGIRKSQSVLPWTAEHAGVEYDDLIVGITVQGLKRLSPDYFKTLDTNALEESFSRFQARVKETGERIQVDGEDFFLLPTLK